MSVVENVRALIESVLADAGFEVVDVEHGRGLLRITLDLLEPGDPGDDGTPAGIDLGAITKATHLISPLLDEHDPIPGRYTLEVTSPGLERKLRTPAHYRRFVGTTVNVKTNPGVEGERRIQGTLTEADDDGITVDGRRLRYDEIERAKTVFEWGPATRPKTGPGAPKPKHPKTPPTKPGGSKTKKAAAS